MGRGKQSQNLRGRAGLVLSLKSTALRGAVVIDPRRQDFFKIVIEERKRLASRTDLSESEKELLDKALKVLANAASYGIYAEMNRRELEKKANVTCYGIDREPFACRVAHPHDPGEYCFSPLASLITGGARLMLALLEHCVSATLRKQQDVIRRAVRGQFYSLLSPIPSTRTKKAQDRHLKGVPAILTAQGAE